MTDIQKYTPQHGITDSWVDVIAPIGDLAAKIADTDFVPADFRRKPAAVAAAVLYGREVGLAPMSALRSINVIKGTPSLESEAMRALILAAGHHLRFVEVSATRCILEGARKGSEDWTRVQYTMDEAKQSGDAQKNPQYRTRPTEMLIARATSRLARMMFADVIGGLTAPEEIDASPLEPKSTEPPKVTVAREEPPAKPKPARKKAAPKSVAAPEPAPEPVAIDGPPLPGEDGYEEIVEPVAEPPIADEPEQPEPLRTEAQSRKLFACLRSLGIASRDEGLEMIGSILGREVESTKTLTKAEAAYVIDALESMEGEPDVIDGELVE